jgi:hypothetical protein
MKKIIFAMFAGGLLLFSLPILAQDKKEEVIRPKNIIKFNLSSVALNHYSFQYERAYAPRRSFALGFGFSPNVSLPFKSTLSDAFGDNEDAARAIESTKFSKITITPEYRFYVGKNKAPSGFYVALFARYSHMKLSQDYTFTPNSGNLHTAKLTGNINGVGAGVMIGSQWLFGKKKNISFDWWIAGPFIGGMNGKFKGTDPDMNELDAQDRADLESDIEGFDIPLWKVDATIGANTIDAKLKGTFFGFRTFGFCLGYAF